MKFITGHDLDGDGEKDVYLIHDTNKKPDNSPLTWFFVIAFGVVVALIPILGMIESFGLGFTAKLFGAIAVFASPYLIVRGLASYDVVRKVVIAYLILIPIAALGFLWWRLNHMPGSN